MSKHFNLNTKLAGVSFKSEAALSNGDYTATWNTPTETVKVAAPSGSTVTLAASPTGSAEVGVTLPTGDSKPAQPNLGPAGSIVANAIAVGYSVAEADALAMKTGVQPNYNVGDIIATPCVSVTGDAGWAWGRACDTQKFLQNNGGGNWILGDAVVGSANDTGCWCLSNLTAWVQYGANNSIFNWSPNATVTEGSCTNWTASLAYNSVGLSASTTVCSDRLDPYDANTGTKFGAAWSGLDCSHDYTQGVASADVDNNPSNASAAVTLYIHIAWNYWC